MGGRKIGHEVSPPRRSGNGDSIAQTGPAAELRWLDEALMQAAPCGFDGSLRGDVVRVLCVGEHKAVVFFMSRA
jgi:hypothetical protein